MNNIKKIDELIDKLKTSKTCIRNVVKENKDNESLEIVKIKRSSKKSILLKKSINSLLMKDGYNFQDDSIVDKNGNVVNIKAFRKKFLNIIKTKLLKSKSLNAGNIKNKKDRYYAFLIDVENPIIQKNYTTDENYSERLLNDNNIKKGMGNF